jgi:hypothetical protein
MKNNLEKIKKAEKQINQTLLKIIIWFTFLLESQEEIYDALKKYAIQIYKHLKVQYKRSKKYYIAFKKRHQEYTRKNIK